ncbi:MAG: hypothetical protein HXS47_02720 [Theionarchaea archaeon]|nr:hypothetical protein [Theionarchaea archaeon]
MEKEEKNLKETQRSKKNSEEKDELQQEIIDQLPPEMKGLMAAGLSIQQYSGPIPSRFFEKITEDHISKILDIAEKDEERSFEDVKSSRKYNLVYVLIFVGLFVFLTIFLIFKDVELYLEVLKIIVVFFGGFGGGFGYNEWKRKK